MARIRRKIGQGALGLLFAALVAGCATTNRKVTVLYEPVVHNGTGAGELYLAGAPGTTGHTGVEWVIGTVKNSDGEQLGDIVSPIAPTDLAMDAFKQELTSAGYTVSTAGSLPPQVEKGIAITGVDIHVEEVSSLVKVEGTSRVKITVELWKDGAIFRKLSYESSFSDFAVKDRDLLDQAILQKALQNAMERAIPEIVAAFAH